MTTLYCDFESRSNVDLLANGLARYATSPGTQILMLGYAFDDEPVEVWTPDQPFPQRVITHIKSGGVLSAYNAQFERWLWMYVLANDHKVPVPRLEQWRCTAARALAHGLPNSLSDVAKALGLPAQKMEEGRRLIQTYCVPGHQPVMTPEDRDLFIQYCRMDVEVERQISGCLRELTDYEWAQYHLNERICERGLPVDVEFARAALAYAAEVRETVNDKIAAVTAGAVPTARAIKHRDAWLRERLDAEQLDVLIENGKIKFGQNYRDAIRSVDIPEDVREFVDLVDEAGGATISKYSALVNREIDGRIHNTLVWNGAGQTGRYASRGFQTQNLRRDGLDDPEQEIQYVKNGYEIPDVTTTLSRLVRASIYSPEGLSYVDWSAIEGRVAPWLEGSELGRAKLDLYIKGVDPYVYNASVSYGIPMSEVTKAQRQSGKIQELALQFGGGVNALQMMSAGYGLAFTDEEALVLRDGWRLANPWAMRFSQQLGRSIIHAVRAPGQWFYAGRVAYAYDGKDWLWCKLPSGRLLAYFQPRVEPVLTPWGEETLAVTTLRGSLKPKAGQPWPRRVLHGSLALENIVQGTAADLLREAVTRADAAGLRVVGHVHDEIICEGTDVDALMRIMLQNPEWADNLPLAGEGGTGTRYGK